MHLVHHLNQEDSAKACEVDNNSMSKARTGKGRTVDLRIIKKTASELKRRCVIVANLKDNKTNNL